MKPLGLNLLGFVLAIAFVFLALSLAGYSTADAPDAQVFPKPADVQNLCGPIGAQASSLLLNVFGLAALFLFLPLGIQAVRFLRGRPLDQLFLRTLGLCFVLAGLSGLCGLFAEPTAHGIGRIGFLPNGPKIGPGGYLGTTIAVLLNRHVALFGSCVLLGSFAAGGIVLTGDRTLLGVLRCCRVSKRSAGKRTATEPGSERTASADDETDEFEWNADGLQDDSTDFEWAGESEPTEPETRDEGFLGWFLGRRMQRQAERSRERGSDPDTEPDRMETYQPPPLELLTPAEPFDEAAYHETVRQQAQWLEKAFTDFGLDIKVVDIQTGPVVSQFEIRLAKGLRLNRILALSDDLAIAMKVPSVRIVAPIPGKNTVGIELPNEHRRTVRLRDVMEQRIDARDELQIPVYLGQDVSGEPMVIDLTKLPHLLIAGRTGTGKSVCLNSIIVSILMTQGPERVRMLMIDPKMVELSPYKSIPHLMHPVVTDMRKAEAILAWAVEKMEERYQLLAAAGVRQLGEYNKLSKNELRRRMRLNGLPEEEWDAVPQTMPYLVIVADEMADLMMTAAKEVETHIIRLAQKSRAVGIHLVLATQKPTVDIITGLIKSNLPARIAFGVATRSDSQVVLDRNGAERLLGNGDMLFLQPGTGQAIRGQGTFVSDSEIEAIIETIGTEQQHFVEELVAIDPDAPPGSALPKGSGPNAVEDEPVLRDELYDEAVEFIIREGRGSLSLLQRRFSIGYGRAARLIDFMAEDGVVGAYNGSQAREVVMTLGDWRRQRSRSSQPNGRPAQPASRRPTQRGASVSRHDEASFGDGPLDDDQDVDFNGEYADEFDYETADSLY